MYMYMYMCMYMYMYMYRFKDRDLIRSHGARWNFFFRKPKLRFFFSRSKYRD